MRWPAFLGGTSEIEASPSGVQRFIPDLEPLGEPEVAVKPKAGDVWKYTGRTTNASKFEAGIRDWTHDENFKILSIENGVYTLEGQYDKAPRTVSKEFFSLNFRFRTGGDIKATRQTFARQAMATVEE